MKAKQADMQATLSFYPPRRNGLVVAILRVIAPAVLRRAWDIQAVELAEPDRQRLRRTGKERAVYVANHPSLAEPGVIFYALSREGVSAHSLVAWDTMALHGRLLTWILQRVGGYSIQRGRRDRAAMQMTQRLLVEGERIVVFPEGQTYGLNDLLLPFQQGVAQMGFWAAEEMVRRQIEAPLLVVPLAIKYVYSRAMGDEIDASLRRLEQALGLPPVTNTPYARLHRIAESLVGRLEGELGQPNPGDRELNQRIDLLRDAMLHRLAEGLKVELPKDAGFPRSVQLLSNAYDDVIYGPAGGRETEDEHAARAATAESVRPLYVIWARLKNFLAVRDGYVQERPTQERFLDVLGRLEVEVLGKSLISGRRRALVRVGEPIDLFAALPEYRSSKRETVERVTAEMEARVRAMLEELSAQKV